MTKRISTLAAGITLLVLAALSIGIFAHSHSSPAQTAQTKPAKDIPDAVIYRHLFRFVNDFKNKADELERDGKDASDYRTHFKRKANLTDAEVAALNEIAAQCVVEMQGVDARAKLALATSQAPYPDGQLLPGQKPPAPPAELKELSAERDAIVLRARDTLRARFGEEEFTRFHNTYVKPQIAQNLQPVGAK